MDPNSQNQTWAKWVFRIYEAGRLVPRSEVETNVKRWLRLGFGSVGTVRISQTKRGWEIQAIIEGANVQDPTFVELVRQQFQRNFVERGWGSIAHSEVSVRLLAGPVDGRPRAQWIGIPRTSFLGKGH